MPRQVIVVNIGGCGVNIGKDALEQFCVEQGISSAGDNENKTESDQLEAFFEETPDGKYVSRTLFVDLDPYSIENVRKRYQYSNVVHSDYMISGKEDACCNFAKGHYTTGKESIDDISCALRTLVEGCDNVQGFIINQSFSGGTGGGFGALTLERIAVDYRKKSKLSFAVFPNENRHSASSEAYNACHSLHWFLDHTEISVVIDNKSLHKICAQQLNISAAKYTDYNNIITKLISNYTANTRFAFNEGMGSIYPGLVPFPRLHFMTPSIAPIMRQSSVESKENENIQNIASQCVDSNNFLIDYPGYNAFRDRYLAADFYFRGDGINKCLTQISEGVTSLNDNKAINWVNFVSDKPTIKLTPNTASILATDIIKTPNKQVTMIGNNTRIGKFFMNRIANKYDQLYVKKSFVHHYVNEGMEEGEFAEAREDLGYLEMDYNDVLSEQQQDEESDESD